MASRATRSSETALPPKKDPHHHHHADSTPKTEDRAEARRGLLKVMIDRFSSTPLQEEEYSTSDTMLLRGKLAEGRNDLDYDASLTKSERHYLNLILQNGDTNSIQSASARLQDESLFPQQEHLQGSSNDDDDDDDIVEDMNKSMDVSKNTLKKRRDSLLQQQLFKLHETEPEVHPSELLQRMSFSLKQRKNSILAMDDSMNNSRSDGSSVRLTGVRSLSPPPSVIDQEARQQPPSMTSSGLTSEGGMERVEPTVAAAEEAVIADEGSTVDKYRDPSNSMMDLDDEVTDGAAGLDDEFDSWNPFEDISSWLDGSQGVEVSDSGVPIARQETSGSDTTPLLKQSKSRELAAPFRILGLSSGDVSCHPHVLSPPLMESLLAFVPDFTTGTIDTSNSTATDCSQPLMNCEQDTTERTTPPSAALPSTFNFWLKYSLVRDGAGLWTFLRTVRASTLCFLAIETDEGHVFGAFTSQPWRLAKGWYGSKDTFLWKMRRSRLETAGKSIVQQVAQESEIQVYPYRTGNAAVQYCSKKCLMLGQGEIIPSPTLHNPDKPKPVRTGKHYGYALYLDKDLQHGTTSTSETFGNPCLTDTKARGAHFNVSNIEVWTLTPHDTVEEAEQSELSNLFLDGGRDSSHRLNFMNILVGGPI